MRMKKVEILSPAGNYVSFKVAINNGADAIYFGLQNFNAREKAENFTLENLRDVVKEAHLFKIKVYLTLNTLLSTSEAEQVVEIVRKALNAKVDAFIVQDLGLLYLLKTKFPNIELHASTQMGISTLEAVQFVEKLGVKRMVLARETPLEEIKRIKKNSNVELEYFVQGALCVGFSGNCYLCSLLTGLSGNRGKCKQFCRLPYTIELGKFKKTGYLLSAKDFCMLPTLKNLVDAGISSIKIEGRARREGYVGASVAIYRKVVDNNFVFHTKDIENLKKSYNRGDFIQGYFANEKIIYDKVQNHIGIFIGKVLKVNKGKRFNEVIISSNHKLNKTDVLKFLLDEHEVGVVTVQDFKELDQGQYLLTTTAQLPLNADVRLIVDSVLEKTVTTKKKSLPLNSTLIAKVGERPRLTMKYDNIIVSVMGEQNLEESKTQPLSKEEAQRQIGKLGENFVLNKFVLSANKVFFPKQQINSLRRNCLEILKEKIIEKQEDALAKNNLEKDFVFENNLKLSKKVKKILIFHKKNQLFENKFDYLIYSPSNYIKEDIFEVVNKYKNVFLNTPVITTSEDINFLKDILQFCPHVGIVANNYYALNLTDANKTIIGSEMNVCNLYALEYYKKLGYNKIILSKEDFFNLNDFNKTDVEVFALKDVRNNYIYFKHCPLKEHYNSSCDNCKFIDSVRYKFGKKEFNLARKKLVNCSFCLQDVYFSQKQLPDFIGGVYEI